MRSVILLSSFRPEGDLWHWLRKHLNFYRIHIIAFVFTPLIFSAVFYASNGRYPVSYIDALFLCVSAMTVNGLAVVNLSQLTGWQQAMLFLLMCLGSPVVVSWVMVYIRKFYFAKKFQYIIEAEHARNAKADLASVEKAVPLKRRLSALFKRQDTKIVVETDSAETSHNGNGERKSKSPFGKLRTDMIRRMDNAPQLVNPSGWVTGQSASERKADTLQLTQDASKNITFAEPVPISERPADRRSSILSPPILERSASRGRPARRLSDPGQPSRPSSLASSRPNKFQRFKTMAEPNSPNYMPRTQTVEFAPGGLPRGRRPRLGMPEIESVRTGGGSFGQHTSINTHMTRDTHRSHRTKHSGFGGFPMPHEVIKSLFHKLFPKLQKKLTRTITMPRTVTIASQHGNNIPPGAKPVPYISFEAVVGRNSAFPLLTDEQMEELGGVEYRALNALLWIVGSYHIGLQLIGFAIVAPYMTRAQWAADFTAPPLIRYLPSVWFSLFQVVSSYTNTGLSLVDTSMIPFQRAYPMIFVMIFLILAGNTCFPIFLRFMIWILTKCFPEESRANETLHFLLDHPRRCFIYLFPSHQTWFLLTVVLGLTFTDWFFFMVLDIGNPEIEAIPLNIRFLLGFLQGIAVRAAGFGAVALSALAPAVKVLYVVMMYISVYPIAMSVRSTNVYEEQSLGVFAHESDDEDDFDHKVGSRMTIWSSYLAMHARKQLSFDMWWLGLALFVVCIIEKSHIQNPDNYSWFTIFNILFELVSAYGGVGLSLGIPTENYSFSGALRPLSKLIVCAVMIRGRHRGLPVAIDRAVLLPFEFEKPQDDSDESDVMPSTEPTVAASNVIYEEPQDIKSSELRQRPAARRLSVGRRISGTDDT